MGESNSNPKRKYTKPSLKQANKPICLPKLSQDTFSDAEDSAPNPSAASATAWSTDSVKLFPMKFQSWPKDALSDDFAISSIFQNVYIHRIDRPKFSKALTDLPGLRSAISRSFLATFGWNPPSELIAWMEAEAARKFAKCPPRAPGGWHLSLQLCALNEETIQKRNFFSWSKSDGILAAPLGLFTGMFLISSNCLGEKLLVSSLPGSTKAAVHYSDRELSYLGPMKTDSLVEFMLSVADLDKAEAQAVRKLQDTVHEKRAKKAAAARQTLFARTRWLVELLDKGSLPESFEQMLLDAPDWDDWQEEKQWIGDYPFLTNYWHIAHWFMGNEGACREAISLARKAQGSITARLADIVGRLLDGARLDLSALRADRIDLVRKNIRQIIQPRMLGPLAKAKRALLAPKENHITSHDSQPEKSRPEDQLLKEIKAQIVKEKQLLELSGSKLEHLQLGSALSAELAGILEKAEKKDTERILQALTALTPRPRDLGVFWGQAMRLAGDLGLDSFAPLAMRYCRTLVEDESFDPHGDRTLCYCLAESARTAAVLIPEKAEPYLQGLIHGLEKEDPSRYVAIGSLLLSGLLMLSPNDKKNLTLLQLALYNRTEPRAAYLYGALRAIQASCRAGKHIDLRTDMIAHHQALDSHALNSESHGSSGDLCQAAESALATLFQKPGANTEFPRPKQNDSMNDISTWLAEQISHSHLSNAPLNQPHHWDGLLKLTMHGKSSTHELWKLMHMENVHKSWIGPILALTRSVTPISTLLQQLQGAEPESIRNLLSSPSEESIGWLDFIAAWASLDASPASLAAVSAACTWRFNKRSMNTEFEEMLHLRLPLVLASFGKRASPHFERLMEKSADEFNRSILENAFEKLNEWEFGDKKPICTEQEALQGLKLEYRSQFDQFSSHIGISSEMGKRPVLKISIHENHKLLDDVIYPIEDMHEIPFHDMDGIQSFTKKMIHVASILGYNSID